MQKSVSPVVVKSGTWEGIGSNIQMGVAMKSGFGLLPIKREGFASHPDAYGIGYDNGNKFSNDEAYLAQLKEYAKWRGINETKLETCSRPHLLGKL